MSIYVYICLHKNRTLQICLSSRDIKIRLRIEELFKRTFTCGSIGKIKVSAEKPATLTYKCRTNTLHFHIHYEITNKFGNITSY